MADAAATDFIKPFAEEIGKSMVTSVKRQINYFCCFTNNVQSFREQATKLEDKRVEVQREVDTAKRNAKLIVPQVDTWLTNIHGIQLQNRQIEPQIRKAQTGCFNILSRFSLSKKAKQKAEAMEKLREDGKFESIFQDAPPPATKLFPLRGVLPFLSRKQIEDKIVNALSVPEVNIVGIGGMGGVGKTTMADKIMHRMKTENLVDETVKVVVSQPIDMLKIQRNIAEYVGLDLKGVELLEVRAQKIRASLTRGKKILIILDDIWEEFKLEDLGIPRESGSNGCTTLVTSRNRELLNQMGAQVYAMETLREDEAWILFRETTGACVDDPDLASTPREVVKECKGLPLAIVTIGKSLKDKPKQTWEDALLQLKRARPDTLSKVLKDVYMPLKVSYDFLEYEGTRLLFLLCCLFPEDYQISLEELTSYSLGLRMFEVDTLEETRNRVSALVDELKSRFLLLDCEDRNEVKMHDVVRDVAIFIASEVGITKRSSKGQHVNNCKWISMFTSSSNESFDDLIGCSFPSIDLLCIQHTSDRWESTTLKINDLSFLKSMQRLSVLSLRKISFESPPQSIKSLKYLRTLRLVGCNMKSISLVGELLNLEILICSECSGIEELPIEIGRLKCLKLLDISRCSALQRIEAGIIAELTELEELKMLRSFNEWESTKVNEKQKRNASIKEIELLHKLACLEIEIEDTNVAEEVIRLPTSIVKYKILIGGGRDKTYENERVMHLEGVSREIQFGSWIQKLVSTTEALYLSGDGSINIDLSQAHKTIQRLEIRNCLTMEALFSTVENGNSDDIIIKFGKLVKLNLEQLPSLTCLVRRAEGIEFPLLEVLFIKNCTNLKTMVSYKESDQSHNFDNDSLHFFCNPKVKCDKLKKLIIVGYENENIILSRNFSMFF